VEVDYDAAPTAGVGTRVSNTNNYLFFNDASSNGFDGRATRTALIGKALTAAEAARAYAVRNAA